MPGMSLGGLPKARERAAASQKSRATEFERSSNLPRPSAWAARQTPQGFQNSRGDAGIANHFPPPVKILPLLLLSFTRRLPCGYCHIRHTFPSRVTWGIHSAGRPTRFEKRPAPVFSGDKGFCSPTTSHSEGASSCTLDFPMGLMFVM